MTDIKQFDLTHKANVPANKITPREVLQMALTAVDDFEYVIVVQGKPNGDGSVLTRVNSSAPNSYVQAGMLHHAQQIITE